MNGLNLRYLHHRVGQNGVTTTRGVNKITFPEQIMQTTKINFDTLTKEKQKKRDVEKQINADMKAFKLCGFRGTKRDADTKRKLAAKRRNKLIGKSSKAEIRATREFGKVVVLKKHPKQLCPRQEKLPPPQDPARYANIELLRCGDVESNPGPKHVPWGTKVKLWCRVTEQWGDVFFQKEEQKCPNCAGRIFYIAKGNFIAHDVGGKDMQAYRTREDCREARSASAPPKEEACTMAEALSKGKEKEPLEICEPETSSQPQAKNPAEPTAGPAPKQGEPSPPPPGPVNPVPAEGAKTFPDHVLDGQRLTNAQLTDYGLSLGRRVKFKGGEDVKYVGERRIAPNRNVEELRLSIHVSKAVFGSMLGGGWWAFLSYMSSLLCIFASIVLLDLIQYEGMGRDFFTNKAAVWVYGPQLFWPFVRLCQFMLLCRLKYECDRSSIQSSHWVFASLVALSLFPKFIGIHVPFSCCAFLTIASHLAGERRDREMQWVPHMLSVLLTEFMFTHSNGQILRDSLVLRAKRLASLPLADTCHPKWMEDTILIAEYLITKQSHFSISPAASPNFVACSDWT